MPLESIDPLFQTRTFYEFVTALTDEMTKVICLVTETDDKISVSEPFRDTKTEVFVNDETSVTTHKTEYTVKT